MIPRAARSNSACSSHPIPLHSTSSMTSLLTSPSKARRDSLSEREAAPVFDSAAATRAGVSPANSSQRSASPSSSHSPFPRVGLPSILTPSYSRSPNSGIFNLNSPRPLLGSILGRTTTPSAQLSASTGSPRVRGTWVTKRTGKSRHFCKLPEKSGSAKGMSTPLHSRRASSKLINRPSANTSNATYRTSGEYHTPCCTGRATPPLGTSGCSYRPPYNSPNTCTTVTPAVVCSALALSSNTPARPLDRRPKKSSRSPSGPVRFAKLTVYLFRHKPLSARRRASPRCALLHLRVLKGAGVGGGGAAGGRTAGGGH
eukprot:Hpha_TRINITY_DN15585_c1_g8::TRINITY_DN15585_c1_g8_i2::g.103892::m.103892